jgi:hypothetical protein
MDNDSFVAQEAVDMRARLNEDRVRQGRRQRRDIVDIPRIPCGQNVKPRANRCISKVLFVENTPHDRDRRLIDSEILLELGSVHRVQPSGFVRGR